MSASVSARLFDLVTTSKLCRFVLAVFPPPMIHDNKTTIKLLLSVTALFATLCKTFRLIVEFLSAIISCESSILIQFHNVHYTSSIHPFIHRSFQGFIMRADVLSKRLFLAGCFGLPWLWCVHVMYWYIKSSKSTTENPEEDHVEALLNADSEGECLFPWS